MKIRFVIPLASALFLMLPALAQRPEERGQQRGQDMIMYTAARPHPASSAAQARILREA
jgi:hypothetical protein